MKIEYVSNINISNKIATTACIGYFDGIHLGHQILIEDTVKLAKKTGTQSALITFDPDPWTIVNDKEFVYHITPLDHKLNILEKYGLDAVYIIQFNKAVSNLTPQEFINTYIKPLSINNIVCGSDFKFGSRGSGRPQDFIESGINVDIVPINNHHDKIGSTSISQAILNGNIEAAGEQLGRPYSIQGEVVSGSQEGRKIGFPTANLKISEEYILPKAGIYAGYITIKGKEYPSVLNVGYNPTFNTRNYPVIESHILDFNQDIYGEIVVQTFLYRLRDELKFSSIDELVIQMKKDKEKTRELLNVY